ncbi:MAG: hypothetical protein IPN63_07810 [Gammaproteobacteria bacterium]|nr:hypothetical protein [Gammaproteobacteria bacterium]
MCVTAEALQTPVHDDVKALRVHEDYLPTFNRLTVHLVDTRGQGITEINAGGPAGLTASSTSWIC